MIGKREIEDAYKNGERNLEAARRLHNWCANAQIENMGYGLLAQQSGLPIGHHGIRCDFASTGGSSFHYELREAAVDFYDMHCSGCTQRKGGRLPNILEWVGERDQKRAEQKRRDEALAAEAVAALKMRDDERGALKRGLSAVGQAIVDDIQSFDHDRSADNHDRLVHSAQLAPEHFEPALVEYVFATCEAANWLDGPGIAILGALGHEPVRLARVAVSIFGKGAYRREAAAVLLPLVRHLQAEDIKRATPEAIDLAFPDHRDHLGGMARAPAPALLSAFQEQAPEAVAEAIAQLLASRNSHTVEWGARGILALLPEVPEMATPHSRNLVAAYVRAELLLDDFSELRTELYNVADAVVGAFAIEPDRVDRLLQDFAESSRGDMLARVYALYARALRTPWQSDAPLSASSVHVRIAFRRILWATADDLPLGSFDTPIDVFRHGGRDLEEVAEAEIEAVLSAPFLLADRLARLEEAPLNPENPLAAIERANERSGLTGVLNGMIEMAARAATRTPTLLPRIGDFLETIPEDRNLLRGLAIDGLAPIASNLAGLQIYLPHLYRAMVGPSQVERSYAASAMGELNQAALDNVPPLLFEAFVPLLLDSYRIVHKAAVRAFRRSALPAPLRRRALVAILDVLRIYRVESGEDNFVAECLKIVAGAADEFGEEAGAIRRYLIDVAMGVDPVFLKSDMRRLAHTLGREPGFAKLVVRMLPLFEDRFNRNDDADILVGGLSAETILAHEAEFEQVGRDLARGSHWLTLVVINALGRAGAFAAAGRVAQAKLDVFEDVPRFRGDRQFTRLILLGITYEQAVAANDETKMKELKSEWDEVLTALESHREEQRESDRRSRFSLPD